MFPEYFDWVIPGVDYEENWGNRKYKEYPPGDASEETIREFIDDAKQAEKKAEEALVKVGVDPAEARKVSCQWPLKDDAPMDIIRNFIGYHYMLQECLKEGKDP